MSLSNGTCSTKVNGMSKPSETPPTRLKTTTSWADMKDEEDELVSANIDHEKEITALKVRVFDLESENRAKAVRIEQLEEKARRVDDLEKQVADMKGELDANLPAFERFKKLEEDMARVTINSMSSKEAKKNKITLSTKESEEPLVVSPTSSTCRDKVDDEASPPSSIAPSVNVTGSSESPAKVSEDIKTAPATSPHKAQSAEGSDATYSSTLLDNSPPLPVAPLSPKANLAQSSTPAPAPVVTFPMDLSKLRKTSAKPTAAGTTTSAVGIILSTKNGGGWSGTQKAKDIRDMSRDERKELFKGPTVALHIGDVAIRMIPKRMFMQVSTKALDYFTKLPQANAIHVKAGSAVPEAVQHIIEWLVDMSTCAKVYSIPLRGTFVQYLQVYCAAKFLGMQRYAHHFVKQLCDEIRSGAMNRNQMSLINNYCDTDDAVFDCLANNLAHYRIKQSLKEPEAFAKFFAAHPKLAKAVELNSNRIEKSRQGRKKSQKELHPRKQSPAPTRGDHPFVVTLVKDATPAQKRKKNKGGACGKDGQKDEKEERGH